MKLFMAVFFFSSMGFAHIKAGKWVGATPSGQACEMTVGDQYFENDVIHPLTERIPLEISSVKLLVSHPAVIDAATSTASFNHDVFQGISPIAEPRGAHAVEIAMRHDAHEGPERFTFITHDYKSDTRGSLICDGLKHTP